MGTIPKCCTRQFTIKAQDFCDCPDYVERRYYKIGLNNNYVVGAFLSPKTEFSGPGITDFYIEVINFSQLSRKTANNKNVSQFRKDFVTQSTANYETCCRTIASNILMVRIRSTGATLDNLVSGSINVVIMFNEIP